MCVCTYHGHRQDSGTLVAVAVAANAAQELRQAIPPLGFASGRARKPVSVVYGGGYMHAIWGGGGCIPWVRARKSTKASAHQLPWLASSTPPATARCRRWTPYPRTPPLRRTTRAPGPSGTVTMIPDPGGGGRDSTPVEPCCRPAWRADLASRGVVRGFPCRGSR